MQKKTKKELAEIKVIITRVLAKYPKARGNDNLLFYLVARERAKAQNIDVDNMSIKTAFCGGWDGLPRFESVVRIRRMIQRALPDLKAVKPVQKGRELQQADFVEYNRKERAARC